VRLKVDVIVAPNNPAIMAAHRATGAIPIVMGYATDPVALGFVASLAQPGGNITGLSLQYPEIAGKRLQLFKETVPNLAPLAVLRDPTFPGFEDIARSTEIGAQTLGVQLRLLLAETRSPSDFDSAFAAMTREGASAVLVLGSNMQFIHRVRIAEYAVKSRLPAMCPSQEYVEAGCLMSYFPSFDDLLRRAAYFVDKILKGAKPGDLPVEQPRKFVLAINLKTAKALGLTIPPSLLLRADQVIE
jgi:putative tryptophan/tyrosine transport system substrate-binding protein